MFPFVLGRKQMVLFYLYTLENYWLYGCDEVVGESTILIIINNLDFRLMHNMRPDIFYFIFFFFLISCLAYFLLAILNELAIKTINFPLHPLTGFNHCCSYLAQFLFSLHKRKPYGNYFSRVFVSTLSLKNKGVKF